MPGRTLMIQGTCSSAGKSLLTAGLCRLFARRGVRVAPYKAQNMSNNAAVCADGSEIGRSQALQAFAAGIEPTFEMNPILLKPEADSRSQVIVNGRPWKTLEARNYYERREELWPVVTSALDSLRERFELVIIEGAGSPAEPNLAEVDLVNMAIAHHADAPVLLAGDIERGGVFAQLLGTLWLLEPRDRDRVKGLIVNKFRGDIRLFDEGVRQLEQRGNVPVLGVVPWIPDLRLPEEDAVALVHREESVSEKLSGEFEIAVIHLPHISNFDDFDPLEAEPGIRLRYVAQPEQLQSADAIILPGTKATMSDLDWLQQTGLAAEVQKLAARGRPLVGICGGYQILGQGIYDPQQIESAQNHAVGLGLLPVSSVFAPGKRTSRVNATIVEDRMCPKLRGETVTGYEIHSGTTVSESPWLEFSSNGQSQAEGAVSADGKIWGCYLHGLFANQNFRRAWLKSLGWSHSHEGFPHDTDKSLDRLADRLEQSLDIASIESLIGMGVSV